MVEQIFDQILEQIKAHDTIILHRHIRPDGDCIGTQQGLKKYLKYNFPEKKIYAVGDTIPSYLASYGENDEIEDSVYENALVIVVDTAVENRICDSRYPLGKYLIKIDHHDDSPVYGDLAYIDPTSPACAAILVRMIRYFEKYQLKINKEIATCFYLAIITDTGRFRFRGVNGEIMNHAGWLLDQGVDTQQMYTKLYMKKKETLKLQGYVYNHFQVTEHGVAYIYFTKRMMKKFHVTKEDAANLVNSLDSIEGAIAWVVFVDQMLPKDKNCINKKEAKEKEIRVRIRSRFVAINEVGTHYRGGGHLQASGATIYSKDEMKNLLDELDQVVKQYKEEHPEVY